MSVAAVFICGIFVCGGSIDEFIIPYAFDIKRRMCYACFMKSTAIADMRDGYFAAALELYMTAFPPAERRDESGHMRAMSQSDYRMRALTDGGEFIGIMFYWDAPEFVYLEHFAIRRDLRGQGYGGKALRLLKSLGKPVILEIEPPIDERTAARKRFYEHNGFVYSDTDHRQRRYNAGDPDCVLKIMSYPVAVSAELYARFCEYLHSVVTSAE